MQFVRTSLLQAFYMYLGVDCTTALRWRINTAYSGSYFHQPLPVQVWDAWLAASYLYYSLEMAYCVLVAVAVTLRIWSPSDCPPLMGSMKDAWSVRQVWGKCWHQLMRRIFGESSNLVLRAFRVRRGTLISSYTQLCTGFIASGLIHFTGGLNAGFPNYGIYHLAFFLIQPLAIMVEDLMIYYGKLLRITPTSRNFPCHGNQKNMAKISY